MGCRNFDKFSAWSIKKKTLLFEMLFERPEIGFTVILFVKCTEAASSTFPDSYVYQVCGVSVGLKPPSVKLFDAFNRQP